MNNEQQLNQAAPKTEIVSTIPVKEPLAGTAPGPQPNTTGLPAADSNLALNQKKSTEPIKPKLPKNHRLGLVVAIACIVAVGLSMAAVVAFRSSL